jgi:hypothetical protein
VAAGRLDAPAKAAGEAARDQFDDLGYVQRGRASPSSPRPAVCQGMEGCRRHPPPGTLPHPLENASRFPQPTGHGDDEEREKRSRPSKAVP